MNSLETLKAFRVFADTLNFTHAAERLHLSQPALHTRIQELSKSLGSQLYIKQGRQLQLTVQGQKLAAFAREIEVRFQDFRRDQPDQPLRLAAGQGAYLYLLGPALKQLKEPAQLLLGGAESVRIGHADLAVGPRPADTTHLELHAFQKIGQVLLLPKDHPLGKKRHLKLKDCRDLQLIVPPADRPQRKLLDSALPPYQVAAEAIGWELTLHFVSLGMGLAIVNSFCPPPPGFLAKPLAELPGIQYQVILPQAYQRPAARKMAQLLLKA
ncbi:MAG: LysR family transcriptional regulator [Candidatus Eremiobacteraeota bacterium]|nr:LysR family transcriptional regulator [Candidatus Eremiobacteraeota bacterium]MCW5871342.1 LysR family transcriptional regulator [Candidatus Eremiobacteraeota bacterium]